MCVLFLAVEAHPRHALVLAGNRDEAHARPTEGLAWWDSTVAAGRDLEAGGTWLGVTRTGRWATVTNVRDPASVRSDARSRGALVADFLLGTAAPSDYARLVQRERDTYNGFNLLVGHGANVWYASSRRDEAARLSPGIYGLSNDALDTPWPKLVRGKAAFTDALRGARLGAADLLPLLHDETGAPDADLPETGVGLELERVLAPLFIRGDRYGTRASTGLILNADGTGEIAEQTWAPNGRRGALVRIDRFA